MCILDLGCIHYLQNKFKWRVYILGEDFARDWKIVILKSFLDMRGAIKIKCFYSIFSKKREENVFYCVMKAQRNVSFATRFLSATGYYVLINNEMAILMVLINP
jgi:hypothetical protein